MSFKTISQCAKSLDFHPRKAWPAALPAMSWKNLLLSGFDRGTGSVVDLFSTQNCHFQDAFIACHPELGLGELSRFAGRLKKADPAMYTDVIESLVSNYHFRWNDRLAQIFAKVATTPEPFQNWLDEKILGPRDLAPLMAVDDLTPLQDLLVALTSLNLSKSLGVQALELVVDLYLMGSLPADLMPTDSRADIWLGKLLKWRKPKSGERDDEMRSKVDRLAWPSHVQAQWIRQGDESGIEIKLRVKSPEDLGNKLEKLNSVGEAWRFLKN